MKILIAGASGFVGTLLTSKLKEHHKITVLGRNLIRLEQTFPPEINKLVWENLEDEDAKSYDLVINLSGSNISAKRWRKSVKKELIESRTLTNKRLIDWLIKQDAKPRYFCANAIGIYGAQERSARYFDENSPIVLNNNDFLQKIGLVWQESLQPAIDWGIPVTSLRFGVILKKGEGMLKKLELPYKLGLGSIIGSGQQMLSWVYYEDLINAICFLLEHPDLTGPINITSPYPVTQKEFALNFAKSLNRQVFFKTPSWLIKTLFGEMGVNLLLKGQGVLPKALTIKGFTFSYPNLDSALAKEYQE